MEWSKVKTNQLKVVAAGVGASAIVAMGALTVMFSNEPAQTGTVSEGITLTLGETTTSTTAPTEIQTSVATPMVTASTPEGFGNGG
jgi:hypothetical protein